MDHLLRDMPFCELRRRLAKFGIHYKPSSQTGAFDPAEDMRAVRILIEYALQMYPDLR